MNKDFEAKIESRIRENPELGVLFHKKANKHLAQYSAALAKARDLMRGKDIDYSFITEIIGPDRPEDGSMDEWLKPDEDDCAGAS